MPKHSGKCYLVVAALSPVLLVLYWFDLKCKDILFKLLKEEGGKKKSVPTMQIVWDKTLFLCGVCACFSLLFYMHSNVANVYNTGKWREEPQPIPSDWRHFIISWYLPPHWFEVNYTRGGFFLHCHGSKRRRKQGCLLFLLHTQMPQKTWSKGSWCFQESRLWFLFTLQKP